MTQDIKHKDDKAGDNQQPVVLTLDDLEEFEAPAPMIHEHDDYDEDEDDE